LLAETKLSAHGVTLVMLEKHAVELLSIWSKIAGNDIAAPASFYSRLLSSIPPGINGAVGTFRSWLADKITDGAPILSEPEKFVDKLLAHARTLGIPAQSTTLHGNWRVRVCDGRGEQQLQILQLARLRLHQQATCF
jgi:hypothetical protein